MALLISRESGDHVERSREYIEFLRVQGQHFAVDHDIDWPIELELHPPDCFALGQRMPNVGSVVQARKIPDQA